MEQGYCLVLHDFTFFTGALLDLSFAILARCIIKGFYHIIVGNGMEITLKTRIIRTDGNVFFELGLRYPEKHILKAELVRQVSIALREEGLTLTTAAKRFGIVRRDLTKILEGHFRGCSVRRLMRFLSALG